MTTPATDLFRMALAIAQADTSTPSSWGTVKAAVPAPGDTVERHVTPAPNGEHLPADECATDNCERPHTKQTVQRPLSGVDRDRGSRPADPDAIKHLVAQIAASPQKDRVNTWVKEGVESGRPFNPRRTPTVRCFETLRAAHWLSGLPDGDVLYLLQCVYGDDMASYPIGAWLGDLTADEAARLALMAQEAGEHFPVA